MQREVLWPQIMVGLTIVVATLLGANSYSAFATEIKIGIVNTVKILRESAPAINAQKKIEQEFFPREKQLKKMAADVEALQQQLEAESKDMSEAEQRDMERKLAALSREYQRAQRQLQEDFSLRQNDERSLIVDYINQAINDIAETEGYDLIFHLQDTVYRSERIDITEQVMKLLEEK